MPEYTYDFNRQRSMVTVWCGTRRVFIMYDVTQRKQAKRLFDEYVREKQERKLS